MTICNTGTVFPRQLKQAAPCGETWWRADRRTIKFWQETTGKKLEWPDHADLAVWLLEQLVEAKHAIDVYDGTIEFARIADLRRAAEIKVLLGKLQRIE